MNQIGERLLSDDRWVNKNTFDKLQSSHISIKEAYSGFSKSADSLDIPSYITIDGVVYEVRIELLNFMNTGNFLKSQGKNSTQTEYGVTLDPDEFYPNETDEEITINVIKADGSEETVTLKNPDYEGEINFGDDGIEVPEGSEFLDPATQFNLNALEAVEYPVFVLTLEEPSCMEKTNPGSGINKVTTNRNWLCIKKIRLYKKLDSGDEEFQFFKVPGGMPNPGFGNVNTRGVFVLDGGENRLSPIGYGNNDRRTTYRKASTNEKTYSPTLALFPIETNTYGGVTFVESDYAGLDQYKSHNTSNDFGTYYSRHQYYRWLPTGQMNWHYQGYGTLGPAPGGKNDDFYTGEMLGINQASVNDAISNNRLRIPFCVYATGQLVTHLRVEFVQESLPYSN